MHAKHTIRKGTRSTNVAAGRTVFTEAEQRRLAAIPLILITSNHERVKNQIVQPGLNESEAASIANAYHDARLQHLALSANSRFVKAQTGEHDVHLIEPDLVVSAVQLVLK